MPRIVIVLLVCVWTARAVSAAGASRLAVVAAGPEVALAGDVLTAGLAGVEGLELVEREEAQRVWREQELKAGQGGGSAAGLGRLLGADGLLVLERRVVGGNETLVVRLMAVGPGVVVSEQDFGLPLAEPVEWGRTFARRVAGWVPKLGVKGEEAVALSVLNLRAGVSTAEGLALEQELTTLVQLRLAREPAVFVLERRRLEELRAEKELEGRDEEPFWNSAYVVDGTINREGVSATNVTVHARVAAPGGAPVMVEVSGRRDGVVALADQLGGRILEALKKYGMIVADNGSNWYISGATDSRWNDDDLNQLKTVPGSAFEVVDTGPIVKP